MRRTLYFYNLWDSRCETSKKMTDILNIENEPIFASSRSRLTIRSLIQHSDTATR